ncbi:hypothetical protein DKX38_004153 [Salix brachista]|uniref:Uncharacterized protein n=1 Tax=Salix brachista TaxID=2182728 RepID=A0A5N5NA22_9ROSI|nr:hypothetical protein DKX38_004153 [Salix brachista]
MPVSLSPSLIMDDLDLLLSLSTNKFIRYHAGAVQENHGGGATESVKIPNRCSNNDDGSGVTRRLHDVSLGYANDCLSYETTC